MKRLPIAVCGSLAYDTIMVFPDRFRNRILPEQIHILNVSFHVPEMRREFGGCAGNIAYGLHLLGMIPVVVAAVGGVDAGPYLERLRSWGVRDDGIRVIPGLLTAQAYIITDLDDNQIAAFHPGAMAHAQSCTVDSSWGVVWGIVAPDDRGAMVDRAEELAEIDVPFLFDPGQGLPLLSREDLLRCLELARGAVVNDYEAKLMEERTGLALIALAERVEALIVTRGSEGALLYTREGVQVIPAAPSEAIVDPTGCGDAFRAGVLAAVAAGADWADAVRLGAVLGAKKVAYPGAQNYRISWREAVTQMRQVYGVAAQWAD
ncbi:MAG: carbohydrate kinase family protein [Hydrogenophilus sp.]|nr:carbohydrate kinase family protein [Hydrogenophilus sp.]